MQYFTELHFCAERICLKAKQDIQNIFVFKSQMEK